MVKGSRMLNKNELLHRIDHVGLAVVTYYVVTSVILNRVAMLGSCTIVDTPYLHYHANN